MNDRDSARRFHESTKHGTPPAAPAALVPFQRLDPRNVPRPFKEYPGLDPIHLPRRVVSSSLPAVAVLSGEKGPTSGLDIELLSTLLFLSAGVTREMSLADRRLYFRAAMSAGNLHPIEAYVVAGDDAVGDLDAGVYHFSPREHALHPLRTGDYRGSVGIESPVAIVLGGIPWRTTWKYGERGWRHLYWDAGSMIANLLPVADAHGLEHRTLLGFDDHAIADLLGIDGSSEMPLAVVEIGSARGWGATPGLDVEQLSVDVAPVAPNPIELPLVQEAQTGSSLAAGETDEWRQAGSDQNRSVPGVVGSVDSHEDPIEEVILRRGSTRRMIRDPVPARALEWPMGASTRAIGIDAIPEKTLLDHYVVVHAVEGNEPGSYLQTADGMRILRGIGSPRSQTASMCLGQPLGGDSAYTVFHCADLDLVLSSLGSRGYRVAQLESGVVSGRLALCAFALGLGATGLTFFDDEVSTFFDTPEQPMLTTAVGVPAGEPAPSGTPGNPAVLRR